MGTRFVGIAEETTYGTPIASAEWLDVVREGVVAAQNFIDAETAAQRTRRMRPPGGYSVGGPIEMIVNPDNITKLLKWLLGDVTTTDDGEVTPVAYKHEFEPAQTLKSFTIEICPDVGAQSKQIGGGICRSIAFAAEAREVITASVEVFGQKDKLISPTTPTLSALDPFVFFEGDLKLETVSVAAAEAFRCTIANDIPDDVHVIGSRFIPGIRLQGLEVTGDMDIAFLNWDYYKRFWGGAAVTEPATRPETVALQFVATGPANGSVGSGFENYLFQIDLPKVTLDTSEATFDRRDRVVESLGFTALYDATATYAVKVTVINKKTAP